MIADLPDSNLVAAIPQHATKADQARRRRRRAIAQARNDWCCHLSIESS